MVYKEEYIRYLIGFINDRMKPSFWDKVKSIFHLSKLFDSNASASRKTWNKRCLLLLNERLTGKLLMNNWLSDIEIFDNIRTIVSYGDIKAIKYSDYIVSIRDSKLKQIGIR